MNVLKIVSGLLMVALITAIALSAAPVVAGPNDNYAVITIDNKTEYRVYYSYRWGESADWTNNSIAPGATYRHWWTFDYQGEDYAPWFYLDNDEQSGVHKMRSFYSPDTKAENGRKYKFDWDEDREKIILYEKRYK